MMTLILLQVDDPARAIVNRRRNAGDVMGDRNESLIVRKSLLNCYMPLRVMLNMYGV